jgi:hypothetical protein
MNKDLISKIKSDTKSVKKDATVRQRYFTPNKKRNLFWGTLAFVWLLIFLKGIKIVDTSDYLIFGLLLHNLALHIPEVASTIVKWILSKQ